MCGNGIVEVGEQCDDGNVVSGDGCRADCSYELIPGNASGSLLSNRHACLVEFTVVNPNNRPPVDRHGRPNYVQTCRNNDPSCDFDLDAADSTCEFHVVACLNNVDPNLPGCTPLGVAASIKTLKPSALRDSRNYTSLTTALQNLRNPATGAIGLGLPIDPGTTNLCSAPFAIRVPLRGRSGRISLYTVSQSVVVVRRATTDRDTVTLVCVP